MINDEISAEHYEMEQPEFTPEELLKKMGYLAYEFHKAMNYIKSNYEVVQRRVEKARVIILAGRYDLLRNQQLAAHLEKIVTDKPGFKPTKEDLQSFVFIETQQWLEPYQKQEIIAKQAEKEYSMWQLQLSYYQTKMKVDKTEMMTLNTQN